MYLIRVQSGSSINSAITENTHTTYWFCSTGQAFILSFATADCYHLVTFYNSGGTINHVTSYKINQTFYSFPIPEN